LSALSCGARKSEVARRQRRDQRPRSGSGTPTSPGSGNAVRPTHAGRKSTRNQIPVSAYDFDQA